MPSWTKGHIFSHYLDFQGARRQEKKAKLAASNKGPGIPQGTTGSFKEKAQVMLGHSYCIQAGDTSNIDKTDLWFWRGHPERTT